MTDGTPTLRFGPVTPTASGTLYAQLIANVKREVAAGRLAANDPLPATRALAADLRVSVITVARAYEELEREGIVHSRQGLRTFVAEGAAETLRQMQSEPWHAALAMVEAARKAGLSDDDQVKLLRSAQGHGSRI